MLSGIGRGECSSESLRANPSQILSGWQHRWYSFSSNCNHPWRRFAGVFLSNPNRSQICQSQEHSGQLEISGPKTQRRCSTSGGKNHIEHLFLMLCLWIGSTFRSQCATSLMQFVWTVWTRPMDQIRWAVGNFFEAKSSWQSTLLEWSRWTLFSYRRLVCVTIGILLLSFDLAFQRLRPSLRAMTKIVTRYRTPWMMKLRALLCRGP